MSKNKTDDSQTASVSLSAPSKSEVKRNYVEIFALAERFLPHTVAALKSVGFSDLIVESIVEASKMPLDTSRKRHLKFITKQLQDYNIEEVRKIGATLDKIFIDTEIAITTKSPDAMPVNPWAEQLINGGNDAIQTFCESIKNADRQHLRNLVRNRIKNAKTSRKQHFHDELVNYIESIK